REYNVPVQRVPVERINKVTRKNHQGVIAFMAAVDYYHVDDIVPALYDEGINPLVVVLDGVTDVRNFGAIARTCECAGVNCIVIPERNSVSVNADAVKTSAGALNYLPVCRERNLVKAVQYLRDSGFKVMGASEKTDLNYTKADFTGPVAIVLGAEDTGISTDVLKLCDTLVAIPEFGQINSLNVSVAGGIMIYEVVRQRLNDGQNVNS
ncbi:MAG: 23S rRNA (guanosine(2251)-2'-O)-methyltransferase RlmB, partial [Muribaculaceae bacterium]|nr:23S rRNA (guanosine(2251)-2'-O)-methyltransferase RlmB [Muribaculaceae bacterium]